MELMPTRDATHRGGGVVGVGVTEEDEWVNIIDSADFDALLKRHEALEKRLAWFTDELMCRFEPSVGMREGMRLLGRRFVDAPSADVPEWMQEMYDQMYARVKAEAEARFAPTTNEESPS